ncbi:MAG: hypothetical protein ACRDQC_14810, partial [Gaiellales bacterium]
PRQRPPAGPSDGPPAAQHAAVVPRPVRRHAWPSLAQRAEAGLLAALPPVVMAAFAAFDRFGARGAQVAALVTLVVLWGVFGALPRAAWIAARGALGAAVGLGAALLLGLALPPDKPIFTAFLFGSFIVGAGYLAGVALAMRDVPVRRPWLPAASETE